MSWLIVTPARNEAERLPTLASSLVAQTAPLIGHWVVVDDGSTDGTADCLPADLPFPVTVIRRDNHGGLAGGSAFGAFLHGADTGLELLPSATRVMKLDADVALDADHFAALARHPDTVGLLGGVLTGTDEVHRHDYTRGPAKAYNRAAFDVVRRLPRAVGFDVVDEVALREAGMSVQVVPGARASLTRTTGVSEGLLVGRRRGGKVARWTGYHPAYFALRLVRYLWRKPYLLGTVWCAHGWLTAGPSPYPAELRAALRRQQSARLRSLLHRPRETLSTYRTPRT